MTGIERADIERMELKRKQVINTAKDYVKLGNMSLYDPFKTDYTIISDEKAEEIANFIINKYCQFTPPESVSGAITTGNGGIGGGTGTKPGNISFNLSNMAEHSAYPEIAIGAAIASPFITIFTILKILTFLRSSMTINLTDRHTAIVWTMSTYNNISYFNKTQLLELVNQELANNNRHPMTQQELDTLLKELEEHKCIKKVDTDKWALEEKVEIEYR